MQTQDGEKATTDALGQFALACTPAGEATLHVQADGFTPVMVTASAQAGGTAHVNPKLAIAEVQTEVRVAADTATSLDIDHGAGTTALTTDDIRQLPDDPDDLLQQLQLLASTGGGASGAATVVVNGFQNGSANAPEKLHRFHPREIPIPLRRSTNATIPREAGLRLRPNQARTGCTEHSF